MFFYLQMRRKMKKYQIIYKDLEKAIHEQKYQVGDFLPTEQELVQSYQVSRDTIRKALTLLVEEGLVKKIHGSGSQVINQEQINFPVSDLTSYQELMEQQGIDSQTNVISLDKIIVDSKLSEKTGFSSSQQVWRVIRQRVVEGCASVVDIDYLDAKLIPQLNRDIAELPPSSVIEQDEQDCDSYDPHKNCQFFIRWFAELKICHKQDTDHCHCNMQCIQKPVISRKYQRYHKEQRQYD